MDMSLKMEVVSAMLIALLMRYSYEKNSGKNIKKRWFRFCLNASMASICVDILSVWAIRESDVVPHWLNMLISALYYLMISFTAGVVVVYLMYLILEHSLSKNCLKKALTILGILYAVEIAAVIYNNRSGCLFYFEDGIYHRGPLNFLGYVIVLIEICMVVRCYIVNREIVNHTMRMVMRTIPFITSAIIVFQLIYRDVLMNGMIAAAANLVIFISFQNSRLGMDYLTSLGNRGAFVEQLDLWKKSQSRFHVIMISLNDFGQVNRKFGQKNGDEFLYAVARYLETMVPNANVFRIGSVEFAVLCMGENCRQSGVCVSEIQKRFEKPWILGEMEYSLSVSCADFIWEGNENDGAEIIEKLEYAMQIARKKGTSHCVSFDREINEMMARQKYVIEQMQEAIRTKSYDVFYQPVYCWKDDLFCSAEALVRLRDEHGNMIYPNEFIPIAEATGMICDISWIVVEKVCAFLAGHRDLPLKAVTINMSMQQFLEEHMEEKLLAYLDKYGIPHQMIRIEITERIVAENPERTKAILDSLIESGIRFYLDDFGVGYSNFSTVLSMPFDTIKVDKTLTDKLACTGQDRMIVDSVIQMLANTDYDIVAEGAETAEVVEALKQLGVNRIQGFYYSRPLPEAQYLEFLSRHQNG